MLQEQNKLQEEQILQLVYFLELTMVQVSEHYKVLYELYTHL